MTNIFVKQLSFAWFQYFYALIAKRKYHTRLAATVEVR